MVMMMMNGIHTIRRARIMTRMHRATLGMALAVGLTGCASAGPMVGPSSHDAAGLRALLTDRVEVAYDAAGRGRGLRIVVNVATMGHFCVQDGLTGFGRYFTEAWTTRPRGAEFRAVVTAADQLSGSRVQYNPETGRLVKGGSIYGVGWVGHLQETIPQAVYSLCPSFPKPRALGFEVNLKQKATDYRKLVAQDPGAVLKGL